ncbi:MAG: IPT/TIG domain-containing protein [Planctomycetes bacterium]|nr:IPT/TIG domain-containing protein [Planctomycetota bacterium]
MAPARAQATRTYTFDAMGNRTGVTNQIRFTSVAGYMIEPTEAIAGDRLNVYGRNFPAGRNANVTVTIAGTPATVQTVGTNVITVTVPAGATTGDVRISILGGPQNLLVGTMTQLGVALTPTSVDMDWSEQFTFAATVVGNTNQTIEWSVNNIVGGNGSVGTITPAGLYTAPRSAPASSSPS